MKIAFICSGTPDGLNHLFENRKSIELSLANQDWKIINTELQNEQTLKIALDNFQGENVDEFLFFYTGHGDTCPIEKKLELKLFYGNPPLSINRIFALLEPIAPKNIAIVLDACYSGNYKTVEFTDKSVQILSSSQYFQPSYEFTEEDEKKYGKKIENSVFSHFFCEAIKELDGKITLNRIEENIRPKLEEHFQSEYFKQQESLLISFGNNPIVLVDKNKNTPKELTLFSQQKETFLDSLQASTFDCSKEEFLECAKEYIGNQLYLLKIEAESNIKNMIKILYDSSQKEDLASILHDLKAKIDFDELLNQWVAEHYNQDNEKVLKEKGLVENQEDRIYVLMQHIEASKYRVIISPRYSKGNNKQFVLEDIDLEECQSKFIDNFGRVKRNASIHLIVPEELYLQNIRLWAKRSRKLLDLAHPLYLHTLERFNESIDNYSWMIEEWNDSFVSSDTLSNSLYLLKSDSCKYKSRDEDGNALLGVGYACQPTNIDEIADPLYDAYVSLWSHNTQTEYHTEIIDKFDKITIENLPQKVNKCKHISLIWDDMSLLKDFKNELNIDE